ncbi:MAG: D-alanyl-D-alanine carboxypeptidase/D-alanyl-D-alanine endopeptidase, partial [Pyrinomonadaceae bacterium]
MTPAAAPAATPAPVATPAPARPAPRTLEELRALIQEVLRQPQLASSHMAVKIASLDTGRTLFEENANKWMQPASNLKLYTVAAALDRLSTDYRFVTSVYAPARPDARGTVRGDLIVYGRGDPTFATRFTGGEDSNSAGAYFKAIDELAARIVAAGVRRVEGDLVGDESYFTGLPMATGWEWDDLQWYYGAEVSALSVNDNAVDLSVKPGARVGDPCVTTVGPATALVTVIDRTTTAPRGTRRDLTVYRPLGENVIEVSGSLAVDDRNFQVSVAVSRPAQMFATMLRTSLERQGVRFTGRTRTVDARARLNAPLPVSALVEIASRQSPPL